MICDQNDLRFLRIGRNSEPIKKHFTPTKKIVQYYGNNQNLNVIKKKIVQLIAPTATSQFYFDMGKLLVKIVRIFSQHRHTQRKTASENSVGCLDSRHNGIHRKFQGRLSLVKGGNFEYKENLRRYFSIEKKKISQKCLLKWFQ